MKFSYLINIIMVVIGSAAYAETLTFVSDPLCPYTCDEKGDEGVMTAIVRNIFKLENIDVVYISIPWSRCLLGVIKGHYSGLLGGPKTHPQDIYYTEEEISIFKVCFYTRSGSTWKFNGLQSLQNVRLGLIQDYGYSLVSVEFKEFLEKNQDKRMIQYIAHENANYLNFVKLVRNRIDVTLSDRNVAAYRLKAENMTDMISEAGCFDTKIRLYVGFARSNPNAEKYVKIFDHGIRKLRKSGRLKTILLKYGMNDWK